jgi:hypothetical protein
MLGLVATMGIANAWTDAAAATTPSPTAPTTSVTTPPSTADLPVVSAAPTDTDPPAIRLSARPTVQVVAPPVGQAQTPTPAPAATTRGSN